MNNTKAIILSVVIAVIISNVFNMFLPYVDKVLTKSSADAASCAELYARMSAAYELWLSSGSRQARLDATWYGIRATRAGC